MTIVAAASSPAEADMATSGHPFARADESLVILHGCRTIPLNKGYVTLIDEEDAGLFSGAFVFAKVGIQGEVVRVFATSFDLEQTAVHRHLMAAPCGMEVDHRNDDSLDNRKANLRVCTSAQNKMNRRPHKGRPYKGVYKSRKRWSAKIGIDGKSIHLGQFDDPADAARAYDRAAVELFGEFARPNFPAEREGQGQ